MSSFKSNLAVGFGLFLVGALGILAVIALGIVVDTTILAAVIFGLNVAIYWCGGWALAGLYKTLAYAFASALVLRVLKVFKAVLA
jgi:hypothetical protein